MHESEEDLNAVSLSPSEEISIDLPLSPTPIIMTPKPEQIIKKWVIRNNNIKRNKPYVFKAIMYGMLTLGLNFSTAFIIATLIPIQVMEMVGEQKKEAAMTIVAFAGAILPSFTGILTGYLSDHNVLLGIKRRFGKRKTFMLIGVLLWATTIMLRSWLYFRGNIGNANNQFLFFLYSVVTTIGFVALSIVWVPYNTLLQDTFAKDHFGVVSGIAGFLGFIGNALGLGLMGFLYNHLPTLILCGISCIVLLISFFCIFAFVPEESIIVSVESSEQATAAIQKVTIRERMKRFGKKLYEFIAPFKDCDFTWIFIARFVILFSLMGLQNYFLYYMKDVVGPHYQFLIYDDWITSANEAQAIFLAFVVISSMFSSILGGIISDRVGRKYVVCVSGMIAVFALIALILAGDNFNILCIIGIFLGLSCGSYLAVDLALINEVVSDKKEETCKLLGVFAVASNMANVLSSPLVGGMLLIGKTITENNPAFPIAHFGYVLTYSLCAVTTFIASLMILFMKKGGPPKRRKRRRRSHTNEEAASS